MDAKKLYKKYLDLRTPKGIYIGDKQMEQIRYEATIDAINEALSIIPVVETIEVDLFDNYSSLPENVQQAIKMFNNGEATYDNCKMLVSVLNEFGYACEYDLDAVPYGLRKL